MKLAPILILLWGLASLTTAQETLLPFQRIEGTLAVGETASWVFNARESAVLSFLAESQDGLLDPVIRIRNGNGDVIISNDDYNYPNRTDALIEAFTTPRTAQYTLEISGTGETSGSYQLEIFEGYPTSILQDGFDTGSDVTVLPAEVTPDISAVSGTLTLSLAGIDALASVSHPRSTASDFYASVDIAAINARNGWIVGMVLRQVGNAYYSVQVSELGVWRFILVQESQITIVRDWTNHPAIVPGQTDFQLAVFASGNGFDIFYDTQYVGSVVDPTLPDAGLMGFTVGTGNAFDSMITATFDNFLVSVPTLVDGQPLLPGQFLSGAPNAVARQLQHMHLIPMGGALTTEIAETVSTYSVAGVNTFEVSGSTTYSNFVYSAAIAPSTARAGISGCGLTARQNDNNYLLAMMDNVGGYGLSYREGDAFNASNFGQYPTPQVEVWLLLIANGETVHLYVNGILSATIQYPEIAGTLGNAVVNYDPQQTTCRFRDVWVWRW